MLSLGLRFMTVFPMVFGLVRMQFFRVKAGNSSGDPMIVLQTDNQLKCSRQCYNLADCQAFRFTNKTCELFNASIGSCNGSGCYTEYTVGGGTNCSAAWWAFEGSCYLVGNSPANFTEAQHFCKSHGGNLIHVNSAPENDFIRSLARTLQGHYRYSWLGLSDKLEEGQWRWVDTNTTDTFFGWAPGEPDRPAEDCAVLESQKDFQWADFKCTSTDIIPLCEKYYSF